MQFTDKTALLARFKERLEDLVTTPGLFDVDACQRVQTFLDRESPEFAPLPRFQMFIDCFHAAADDVRFDREQRDPLISWWFRP